MLLARELTNLAQSAGTPAGSPCSHADSHLIGEARGSVQMLALPGARPETFAQAFDHALFGKPNTAKKLARKRQGQNLFEQLFPHFEFLENCTSPSVPRRKGYQIHCRLVSKKGAGSKNNFGRVFLHLDFFEMCQKPMGLGQICMFLLGCLDKM